MNLPLFVIAIITQNVLALPANMPVTKGLETSRCLSLTPAIEAQIETVVERFSKFLDELADEVEDVDIRMVTVDIDQHFDDEAEDKETVFHLRVNDCPKSIEKSSKGFVKLNRPDEPLEEPSLESFQDKRIVNENTNKPIISEIEINFENSNINFKEQSVKAEQIDSNKIEVNQKLFNKYDDIKAKKREPVSVLDTGIKFNNNPNYLNKSSYNKDVKEVLNAGSPSLFKMILAENGEDLLDKLKKKGKLKSPVLVYIHDLDKKDDDLKIPLHDSDMNTGKRNHLGTKTNEENELLFDRRIAGHPKFLNLSLEKREEVLLDKLKKNRRIMSPMLVYVQDSFDLDERLYVILG